MPLMDNLGLWFLVVSGLILPYEARPPQSNQNKNGGFLRKDNDSSIIRINKLPVENVSLENEEQSIIHSNKTKTRILFRGSSHKDGYNGDYSEPDIIFPDTYQVIFEQIPRIDATPKCAQGGTFCETFDSYPHNHVQSVLRRQHIHNDLFGQDEGPDDSKFNISNRIGEVEEFVCTSLERTVFPKVGKNKNNKWKFIINQGEPEGYVQGVRIETCRRENAPCDLIGELPNGYITSCKQKFIYRRMMSINDNGDPMSDTFQLPSACCCSYRRDVGFLSRFAAPISPLRAPKSPLRK